MRRKKCKEEAHRTRDNRGDRKHIAQRVDAVRKQRRADDGKKALHSRSLLAGAVAEGATPATKLPAPSASAAGALAAPSASGAVDVGAIQNRKRLRAVVRRQHKKRFFQRFGAVRLGNLRRRAVRHAAPVVQNVHVVAERVHFLHQVRRKQHRVRGKQAFYQRPHPHNLRGV